jgi:putative aldouronate transport system permease protein
MWALILPGALGVYNMVVARTFFTTNIPGELMEAAKLDGCGNTKFFLHIVLPLSGAITAILFLYYGVGHWNSYFSALLYISDRKKWPLQMELRNILLQNSVNMSSRVLTEQELAEKERLEALKEMMKYSLIIISSIPVLVIYPFVQKHFVKGVMIGSVKG